MIAYKYNFPPLNFPRSPTCLCLSLATGFHSIIHQNLFSWLNLIHIIPHNTQLKKFIFLQNSRSLLHGFSQDRSSIFSETMPAIISVLMELRSSVFLRRGAGQSGGKASMSFLIDQRLVF